MMVAMWSIYRGKVEGVDGPDLVGCEYFRRVLVADDDFC